MSTYQKRIEFRILEVKRQKSIDGITYIKAEPLVDDFEFCEVIEITVDNKNATRLNISKMLNVNYYYKRDEFYKKKNRDVCVGDII